MRRVRGYNRFDKAGKGIGHEVSYYAHTAVGSDGTPDRNPANWQLLSTHLLNVAKLAERFAEPLDLAAVAWLAGLLHDLGKYRAEFQQYLRNERKAGSDTHHAIYGAAHAFTSEWLPQAFAIAGHHAGLPDQHDLQNTVQGEKYDAVERAKGLFTLLKSEVGELPRGVSKLLGEAIQREDVHCLEFATRMVFSALVDADRLDSANWPQQDAADDELTPQKSGDLLASVSLSASASARASQPAKRTPSFADSATTCSTPALKPPSSIPASSR